MDMFQTEWILRLAAAVTAGMMIGYERHSHAKEAGIRTHSMVALGACLLMIISKYGYSDIGTGDPARTAAQVVSGVGFLGAGVIFVRNDIIQGLTTAAGIWATSAIGLCFGAGMYIAGVVATGMMFVIQNIFRRFLPRNTLHISMHLRLHLSAEGSIDEVTKLLHQYGFHHTGENKFRSDPNGGWVLTTEVITHQGSEPKELLTGLNSSRYIISAEII